MLIQQFDEKMRRFNLLGVGRVVSARGYPAIRKVNVLKTEKLSFSVRTGLTVNYGKDKIYQAVPCAIYNYGWNSAVYNAVSKLKKNDLVFFAGYLKEEVYNDSRTGEQRISKECRLEWIAKMDNMGNVTYPKEQNDNKSVAEPLDNNDDYLF